MKREMPRLWDFTNGSILVIVTLELVIVERIL